MRVLILGRADHPIVRRRVTDLVALGHAVHLLSVQPAAAIPGAEVRRLRSLGGPLRYLSCLPSVRAAISRLEPDVVDIQGLVTYGVHGVVKPPQTAMIATVTGSDVSVQARAHKPLAWMAKRVLGSADLVYGSSPVVGESIREVLGVELGEKLQTHTWGIPVEELLRGGERRRETIRKEMSIRSETKVVLHNRCLLDHWRVRMIVESIPMLLRLLGDVCFWFVYVRPNRESRRCLDRMRRRIAELGVESHVRLLGPQPFERAISVLHAADLYLSIGKSDLLASSLLEAVCVGVVPVVSRLPAYAEVFGPEESFYLDNVSPEALAGHVADTIRYLDRQKHRLLPVTKRVREAHDSMAATRWLVDFYRRAMGRESPNGPVPP